MVDKSKVLGLVLENARIVGWGIIGCGECPLGSRHSDINPSDPDEGYYSCDLLGRQKVWGENPLCSDRDWINYIRANFVHIVLRKAP